MDSITLSSCYHARQLREAVALHLGELFVVPSCRQAMGASQAIFIGVRGAQQWQHIIDVNAFLRLSLNQKNDLSAVSLTAAPGDDNARVDRRISSRPPGSFQSPDPRSVGRKRLEVMGGDQRPRKTSDVVLTHLIS
jgi:hypothetical protein